MPVQGTRSVEHGHHYAQRATGDACMIADEEKHFEEMFELRIFISKCFSKIASRKLEAQLAALGCIHLVFKRFPDKYISRYILVSYTNCSYSFAHEAGKLQKVLLNEMYHKALVDKEVDWETAEKLVAQYSRQIEVLKERL